MRRPGSSSSRATRTARWVGPTLFALFLTPLSRAADSGLPLELEWQAPKACATGRQLRTELARIAHAKPGRVVPKITARGRIDRAGDTYRLSLRTERSGEVGERHLTANECRSLEREVTLVLAVAFGEGVEIVDEPAAVPNSEEDGKNGAEVASSPGMNPDTAKPAKSAEASARPPDREETNAPRTTFHAAFFGGGGVALRTLPSPASHVTAGAELGSRRVWFEPRLTWLPLVHETLARHVQARYGGVGGAASACYGLPALGTRLAGCAGGEVLALRGRGAGATESGDATALLYAVNALASWQWPADSTVALRADIGLRLALNAPRFLVEGLGEAYRVPRFAPFGGLAIVFSPWH